MSEPPVKVCSEDGCERVVRARGMCEGHYNRRRREDPEYRRAEAESKRRRYAEDSEFRRAEIERKRRKREDPEIRHIEAERKRRWLATPEGRRISAEASHRRRARQRRAFVENVDPQYIYERDGWRCHLRISKSCKRVGGRVDPTKKAPHLRSPTIDHVQPLGPGDHAKYNVKTACYQCNSIKGAKPIGQPMIPGLA